MPLMTYTSATTLENGMRCHTEFFDASRAEFSTEVDAELGGRGELPSPGDMLAATVASCMLSMMAYTGARKGIATAGTSIQAACGEGKQGIGSLHFDITVPAPTTPHERRLLEAAVASCPVGNSIHPDIPKEIVWHWAN